jgi:hypothetical protein
MSVYPSTYQLLALYESLKACSSNQETAERVWRTVPESAKTHLAIRGKLSYFVSQRLFDEVGYKRYIALNPNTSVAFLDTLALDSASNLKEFLVGNLSLSSDAFLILAKDNVWFIAEAIARNPRAPAHVLSLLSEHSAFTVRFAVVENLNTIDSDIIKLSTDKNDLIKSAAISRAKSRGLLNENNS